jgi:hypothetical protein
MHSFITISIRSIRMQLIQLGLRWARKSSWSISGTERDPARRFALWTLMEAFGIAPPPTDAFKDPSLRRAAEDYLTPAWRLERD